MGWTPPSYAVPTDSIREPHLDRVSYFSSPPIGEQSRATGRAVSKEQIWAPWRLDYIVHSNKPGSGGCFLCEGLASDQDRANLILRRTDLSVTVLNRYPYTNGHLLVAPLAHKANLGDLSDEELLDCVKTVRRMIAALDQVLQPQGYNVGLNLGQVAGAGLPGHLHWHLVPRWSGDTNFMPVLADANVIPQSLDALYEQLAGVIERDGIGSAK